MGYQRLVSGGIPRDHIIVMQYADVAGDSVTAEAVLAVLTGQSASGPVLKSGPDDDVTLVWAGHGGAGMLYMPDNSATNGLYADQLMDAFRSMRQQGMYGRLL